jgi:hypothetical protein
MSTGNTAEATICHSTLLSFGGYGCGKRRLMSGGLMLGDANRDDLLSPPPLLSVEDLDRQRFLEDLYGQIAQVAAQIAGARASLKALQTKQDRALKVARDRSISAETLHERAEGRWILQRPVPCRPTR